LVTELKQGGGGGKIWRSQKQSPPHPRQREQTAAALAPSKSIDPAVFYRGMITIKPSPTSSAILYVQPSHLIWLVSISLSCLCYGAGVRDEVS